MSDTEINLSMFSDEALQKELERRFKLDEKRLLQLAEMGWNKEYIVEQICWLIKNQANLVETQNHILKVQGRLFKFLEKHQDEYHEVINALKSTQYPIRAITHTIELNGGFEVLLGKMTHLQLLHHCDVILITIPEEVFEFFEDKSDVLHATEHILINTMKDEILNYDPEAIISYGGSVFENFRETRKPTILIYATEGIPFLFGEIKQIIKDAYNNIKNCPCVNGCHSCIISEGLGNDNDNLNKDSKASAIFLLAKMVEGIEE